MFLSSISLFLFLTLVCVFISWLLLLHYVSENLEKWKKGNMG